MSRLILAPLALLVLVVLGAAVLIPLLLDKDEVLRLATATLHEHTGATLTVHGQASLSLFPALGISVSDAAITLPEQPQSSVRISTVQLGVQFLPLLRGLLEIDTLALNGIRARIESGSGQPHADGDSRSDEDLDALYSIHRERMAKAAKVGVAAVVLPPLALQVKQLTITDARVELIDTSGAVTQVLELARLEASDLNLEGAAIPLDIALRLPGKQVIDAQLKGIVRVDQQHQTVTLDQLELAVSGALANPLHLRGSGTVDLVRQIADLKLALETGATRGNGTLRYSSFESPQIDSVMQLNLLDPALLALAGPDALKAAGQQPTTASADSALPLDALRAIDARTVLHIEKARWGAHTVHNLHARVVALDGVIQVAELTGELHGGRLEASGTLNARHNAVTFDTSGSLSAVDLAAALAAMEARPTLSGNATVNWQLRSQGNSVNALTTALQGPVTLTTQDVTLRGMSVEKLLCQAMALSNQETLTATFPTDTRFTSFTADIQVAAGRAALNPLNAALAQVALNGSGHYDLLQKTFDTTFKARLSPQLEQLDPACRVSKRLLAVDLPVQCTGSIADEPAKWCRVDAAKILQDLTANEGLEKLGKKASKFLDKLFNKDN